MLSCLPQPDNSFIQPLAGIAVRGCILFDDIPFNECFSVLLKESFPDLIAEV
jgi:hypothetical protein